MAKQEEKKRHEARRFISDFALLERERKRPYSWIEIAVALLLVFAVGLALYDAVH